MFDGFYHALESIGYTHPVHPTQVNMPIGFAIGTFLLALAALWLKHSAADRAARYTFILALLFIFPTVAAGFMDWQHYYHGLWLFPIKVKAGLATFLFFLLVAGVLMGRRSEGIPMGLLTVYLLSAVTVVALGYFGAQLVFGGKAPPAPARYSPGLSLYLNNCSECHPYGANSIKPRMPIIGSERIRSPEMLTAWIRSPEDPMPEFPESEISKDQANALWAYINYLWGGGHHHEEGEHNDQH